MRQSSDFPLQWLHPTTSTAEIVLSNSSRLLLYPSVVVAPYLPVSLQHFRLKAIYIDVPQSADSYPTPTLDQVNFTIKTWIEAFRPGIRLTCHFCIHDGIVRTCPFLVHLHPFYVVDSTLLSQPGNSRYRFY